MKVCIGHKLLAILLVMSVLPLAGCQQSSGDIMTGPGNAISKEPTSTSALTVSDFAMPILNVPANKTEISLQELQDQWVLVNYWAEWCAPCRVEIPDLNQLNERSDVQVLGVDFDQHVAEDLVPLIKLMQIEFPVLLTDQIGELKLEQPNVLPVTYVIHRQQLIKTLQGPQTWESLTELLTALASGG